MPQLWLLLALGLWACTPHASSQPEAADADKTANPAATKCMADGHETRTLEENGIPRGTLCVSRATGKRCEAWSYWRGECSLDSMVGDENGPQTTNSSEPQE